MPYYPKPFDTSCTPLSPEVLKLTERLARNAHARWAKRRQDDGWIFGSERDDKLKRHPDLVPYDDLPESEREYDRVLVKGTLQHLVALGYKIVPPSDSADSSAMPGLPPVFAEERDFGQMDFPTLLAVWRNHPAGEWPRTVARLRALAERLLSLGEPLVAYDVVDEGRKRWPDDFRLRQLEALALIRSGAPRAAIDVLKELKREKHSDEETLGLLARAYKDCYFQSTNDVERRRFLSQAEIEYQQAYRLTGGYWTGVNAATMALLRGNKAKAVELAQKVRAHCLEALSSTDAAQLDDLYWVRATVGETSLILQDWKQAQDAYSLAAEVGADRYGDISATRRNARLILKCLEEDPAAIERCLTVPWVVVFSGHRIDEPGRAVPRFPPGLRELVRDAIRERLERVNVGWGYASAACGSDLLFLESILEREAKVHVVLPFEQGQLKRENRERMDADWDQSFDYVLDNSSEKILASDYSFATNIESYHYANRLRYGLARLRAAQLDTELVTMAVWDGNPDDRPGGTASCVKYWKDMGHAVDVIDLKKIQSEAGVDPSGAGASGRDRRTSAGESSQLSIRTMAVLFADAVGFSRLREKQIPLFFRHFLGEIARRLADFATRSDLEGTPSGPELIQTAGDGLYMVFEDLRAAALFALEMTDAVGAIDWAEKGLPESLSLRTAIHVGPICSFRNPITGQVDYTGSHTVRAARLEPMTPPGWVYVTEAFAALAISEKVSGFTCDYVGRIPLAKDYGIHPIYRLRRG